MSEIHDSVDNRLIDIQNVGVCNYVIPFTLNNGGNHYNTIATIKSGVSLDASLKGAHLSRIVETIDEEIANKVLSLKELDNVAGKLVKNVGVNNANITLLFNIVFNTMTPISNKITYLNSKIELYINKNGKNSCKYIKISGNGAMLCPNSKSKSKYGAHSQKCDVSLTLYENFEDINLFDYYSLLANSTSAPVFGIVKSVDEVYMTEFAYDNPKFSEDVIRDLLIATKKIYKKGKIKVELENYESIHQHNVFCVGELNK